MEYVRGLPLNGTAFVSVAIPPHTVVNTFCTSEQRQYLGQPTCPFQPFAQFWSVPTPSLQVVTPLQHRGNCETAPLNSDFGLHPHEIEDMRARLNELEDELFSAEAKYSFEKKKRESQVLYCDQSKEQLKKLEATVSDIYKTLSFREMQLNTIQQQLNTLHEVKAHKEVMLEQTRALSEQVKASYNEYLTSEVVDLRKEYEKAVQALTDVKKEIESQAPTKQKNIAVCLEERENYIVPMLREALPVLSKSSEFWTNYYQVWSTSKVKHVALSGASSPELYFYEQDNVTESNSIAYRFKKAKEEVDKASRELNIKEQQLKLKYKHVEQLNLEHKKIKQECAALNQTIAGLETNLQAQKVEFLKLQEKLKQGSEKYIKDEKVARNLQEKCITGSAELEPLKAQCRDKQARVDKLKADLSLVENMKFSAI
ncbi:hypothetical protein SOPP22_04240 [Shewanella sp. OPT22]|nr:hypothetical protein SOPP22_04240 [Shewanella sp. OPT22]